MSDTAIKIEGLGKEYRIGAVRDRNPQLRDAVARAVTAPFRRLANRGYSQGGKVERVWALRDVDFEVKRGDTLGIIGRNGAGKSTLLKILSRITEPTTGRVEIYGRVGSLLEVGTGFHPELTGRENVFLNGAILGMTRKEVRAKFDDIVEFSEIGRFVDTPVKRYSSGMYVRLAFAVAAHLEPDILVVDEVLSVGDYTFQKKCLGRMGDVAGRGRTVLFVSHNMGAISTLCSRAVLLDQGRVLEQGPTDKIVTAYVNRGLESSGEVVWQSESTAPGAEALRLHAIRIVSRGDVTSDVHIDEEVRVEVEYWNFKPGTCASVTLHLVDKSGVVALSTKNSPSAALNDDGWSCRPHPVGLFRTACSVPPNFLNDGLYKVDVYLVRDSDRVEARLDDIVSFTVHDTGVMRQEYTGPWPGTVRPRMAWETEQLGEYVSSIAGD